MSTRELGDYLLIKQLGRGSLGIVYLAEHRFMQKQFAIKILPEELSIDRAFIQRFQEDVGRLAALQHPNIVAIHNVCFHDGIYFLVTDCIVDETGESTNLYHYLKSQPEPIDEESLLHHLGQIASALDYAHTSTNNSKGTIHRGIKLSNVLVGNDKDGPSWYLSDFGLSRIIGCGAVLARAFKNVADTIGSTTLWAQAATEESRYPFPPLEIPHLTSLQQSFLQTFAFLSPEQKCIDGTGPISYKSDIYSFGILVYYILTGAFPEGYFPLPSELRPELKYAWDKLLVHCLKPDPAQRPDRLSPLIEGLKEGSIDFNKYRVEVPNYAYAAASHLQKEIDQGLIAPGNMKAMEKYQTEESEPSSGHKPESAVKHYTPERKEQRTVQPLLSDMAQIQGGTFWRGSQEGSRDEMPSHQVNLDSFLIDVHPVTNEQFARFLEYVGGEKDSYHRDLIRLRDSRIKRSGGKLSIESGYSKHPVVGVTWYGAMAYAKWVGKRLPTEAEWEVAASCGEERLTYPTGDEIEKSQANFFSSDTTSVMSYAPNHFGLYDMAGNVYEWCQDWYGYNYYETSLQEPDNPKGPLQGNYRVLRGGCWKSLKEDLRCSKRHRNNPGTVNSTYGFRCASDVVG